MEFEDDRRREDQRAESGDEEPSVCNFGKSCAGRESDDLTVSILCRPGYVRRVRLSK